MKNTVRSAHVAFHFISFYSFVLTFAMHRNMLIVKVVIFQRKISDFLSFPLSGLTLVIKLRNFDSESYLNTLIIFFYTKQ